MKSLTKSSREQAIQNALDNSGYRVGIFVAKNSSIVVEHINVYMHSPESEIYSRSVKSEMNYIQFKNGSEIRIINASNVLRGRRFHEILASQELDTEFVRNLLAPFEIPYFKDHICEYDLECSFDISQDLSMLFSED